MEWLLRYKEFLKGKRVKLRPHKLHVSIPHILQASLYSSLKAVGGRPVREAEDVHEGFLSMYLGKAIEEILPPHVQGHA